MKSAKTIIITALCACLLISSASAAVRLKDVAQIRDQKSVQLTGLGLVVGLAGTGDNRNTQFTIRMIGNLMLNSGVDVPATTIKVKNVAAVMVTATVSPYVKDGGTFDVTVSSTGDAVSLEGGTLLVTHLKDSMGRRIARAQGPLTIGGTSSNVSSTVGAVPNGGLLLRELPTISMDEHNMLVTLVNPDFTTAFRLAEAINEDFGLDLAIAQDAGSIIVNVPDEYAEVGDLVRFISEVEAVSFEPDNRARVIINERTGTIVAGGTVSLGAVAITHGNLSLVIEDPQAQAAQAQPALPGQGPQGDRLVTIDESSNVNEVAQALNQLGVSPNDLIAIFQALKRSGSLRAELVFM